MKEIYAEMKQNIDQVANKLELVGHPRTNELRRIAQFFGDMGQSTNMMGGGAPMPYQTMASEEPEGPTPDSLNPNVSSYVKMRPGEEPEVDTRKTHTCTVMFKAPEGVSEADMMNYILGIGAELGVDVETFKWSKSDAKQNKSVV